MSEQQDRALRALVVCVACGRGRRAEAVAPTLAGPVCAWCANAAIDWDGEDDRQEADEIPLDRIKRRAGDPMLPGMPT